MKLSQFIGQRLREVPRDAQTASHKFLLRGGYCRSVSAGLYSLLPAGCRIVRKIEAIIREEMNRIGGQEVLMPLVLPAELWRESGRYESVGPELLRFRDRNDKEMLLGMTHEEAVVHLARTELPSHRQLPAMMYQIQVKYRDEARPRAGLIRVREFTMKDAYSFHISQECLEEYYQKAHQAYERIFQRLGLRECVSILSDSGMIGGALSHEFMAIAECGEDTLFCSPDGRYRANREVACSKLHYKQEEPLPLEKVATPDCKSIEEVAAFLQLPKEQTGKALFYKDGKGALVLVSIRGDLEVNEAKLKKLLGEAELDFADDQLILSAGAVPGYASLLGLKREGIRVLVDHSLAESSNLVVGANEAGYHCRNFNFFRDLELAEQIQVADLATVREGDPCPLSGEPLQMHRGIEVGNIFQLGTKYSKAMHCNFLGEDGQSHPMIMGCYGIGVGRAMAAVIEQNHDDYGPVWPLSIAPFQVHLIGLNQARPEVSQACELLYKQLQEEGLEVLYDDRGEKAGSAFADADLLGIPFRIVLSPKTLDQAQAEFKRRHWGRRSEMLPLSGLAACIKSMVQEELRSFA
ncbi:MAG: proline--tRNA ligase [Lentisphaeria bacterium]|nr:proline--tRNA ligase [Lentisphaeria bacterium]NLZ60168.1 proline--tRNA ligase [Lentisphaerota bacterium]